MPTATTDKLNQLRQQLQDCTNPKVAQALRGAIAKLEAQLNPGTAQAKTPKAKSSQIAERKAALKESQRQANRVASRHQKTKLKPPSPSKAELEPEATSQNGTATASSQDKSQELTDAIPQSETPTTQDSRKPQTDPSLQNKNPTPANQSQGDEISLIRDQNPVTQGHATPEANTKQQQATKTSKAKFKHQDRPRQKQPLLPGNGTHRAWCRIPGIIRVQEGEEQESLNYFLEFDGHQIPLRVKNRFTKLIGASLDQPLMVKCYPRIIEGQMAFAQFCGTAELTPENPEAWVMIGVWTATQQRVLVQRDRRCDLSRRILALSPQVSEDCLEQLEDRKLYRFECQREGITVAIVGVEAMANELPNGV